MIKCSLCPRRCNASRTETENLNGYCKMPLLPRVARAALHFWEEPSISGTKGSGTIFFSGCSLSCVFCQNYYISHENFGETITINRLAEIFYELEQKGAHNINLVNPTHYVYAIKKALDIYRPGIPIVYNSGGYDNASTISLLKDYIDIYLFDFKYFTNERALLYSNAFDYPEIAKKAILEGIKNQPNCIFDGDLMKKGVIIRHLLLPQGTNDAISIFDWVKENANNSYFSFMSQYTPYAKALEMPIINRKITKREYNKVLEHIFSTDFSNIYIQERESGNIKYIPEFNLYGVKKEIN